MKNFITTIALLLTIGISTIYSKEVSTELAKTVAVNFLSEQEIETISIHNTEPILIRHEGISIYYIFKLNKGFIIISADNSIFPILGYSVESNFYEKNLPPSWSFWMTQFEKQISHNKDSNLKPGKKILGSWQKYGSEDFSPSKFEKGISPILSSTWDQGCFYNTSFPEEDGPCDHTYAGCVAVAMGQIMNYYNWPKTGTGENTISSPYGELKADFGSTTYNWLGMETYLDSENPAVAELLYHNAIAVNSEFYPQGTGAYDYNIPPALEQYFDYKETVQFIYRNTYFGDWEQLIRDELDNGRPVVYGGIDTAAYVGHTFICDGYQDNSFFHFNWGWGGQYNGYYYLESLIVGPYHFDVQHDLVIGIEPDIEGEINLFPPANLSTQVAMRDVSLSWEAPTGTNSLELLGYNVYRNDTLLNKSIIDAMVHTDLDVPPGNHTYKVQSVFIGSGSGPSTSVETFVSGISDQDWDSFVIFPNPAKDKIYIKSSSNGQNLNRIELYDLSGKKVCSLDISQISNGTSKVDLPANLKGIYILQLVNDMHTFSEKLMINSK